MKTLGIIGGMSWTSTAHYYQLINEGIRDRLGALQSAELRLWSVNFARIAEMQANNHWETAAQLLTEAAIGLQNLGCDGVLIATNTMHKIADHLKQNIEIPLLHIVDCTADALETAGIQQAGLLGTAFTMEEDFYRNRLQQRHGLKVLSPPAAERQEVHRIIFDELCQNQINPDSRQIYINIINGLEEAGSQAIILGCTEIGLLVQSKHSTLPLFDTTAIHAEAAINWMLQN